MHKEKSLAFFLFFGNLISTAKIELAGPMKVFIIGGGIVGLATAYQLQKKFPSYEITLLEKEASLGFHQTGNNSGVVHSGIYGSLKARNCVEGKKQLLTFCDTHNIPYAQCKKVLVATEKSELPTIKMLKKRGDSNGVAVKEISPEELREIEPYAQGIQALLVPKCQIIDYGQVAQKLGEVIQRNGGKILLNHRVESIRYAYPKWNIDTSKNTFTCDYLINAAGLYSDRIAEMALPDKELPCRILPFRGEYYLLKEDKRNLVNGLIYPVPNPKLPFLGVHLTRMINGQVEAGPNAVLAMSREGYRKTDFILKDFTDTLSYSGFWKMSMKYWKTGAYEMYRSMSKNAFVKSLQRLLPSIDADSIIPGGSGVRAQAIKKDDSLADDFLILQDEVSLHVLNAPSPAATSSFSIGQTIVDRIKA